MRCNGVAGPGATLRSAAPAMASRHVLFDELLAGVEYIHHMGVTHRDLHVGNIMVNPTPATHAILAQLKTGETVYQAGELPKTLRVSKTHYELPKTVCKTPFASIFPPSMENGDGTRSWTAQTGRRWGWWRRCSARTRRQQPCGTPTAGSRFTI